MLGPGVRAQWEGGASAPQGRSDRRFVLTGHTDQSCPEEQVDQPAPALRHPGHEGRDDDLSRHVELHGVGEENPKGEEQLDSLVQPAKERTQ